jgi:Mce-associated membrane protein
MTGRQPWRLAVVSTVAALSVLAAGLAALATQRVSHRHALDEAREGALAAATNGAATMLSYDYRHLTADIDKASALLTPRFRARYDKTMKDGVKPLAVKYHARTSAAVTAAASVSTATDRAVVLVFVAQTVSNSQLSADRLDRSRNNVTLVRRDGRWLIDDLSPV